MNRTRRPLSIGIVGAGRVGTSFGSAWVKAGHRVRFVSAARLPTGLDVLLLAVPDRAVATVAAEVGARCTARVAAHVSGSLGLDVLRPLESTRTHLGSLHPLLAVSRKRSKLAGGWAAVDGDAVARHLLGRLAKDAGLRVLSAAPTDRMLYHLGAALSANSLAPLVAEATALFVEAGVPPDQAHAALAALMASAVASIAKQGAAEGLTGPVARGDLETIERHLHALGTTHPAARRLYVAAGLGAAQLAGQRRPPPPNLARITALLSRRVTRPRR